MDNVTHTLAGLVVADAAFQWRSRLEITSPGLRVATATVSALANNLPDLDFLYRGITDGKLGYLLHHRGHTHTLAAVLPLALVCAAGVSGWLRLRGQRLARSEHGFLFGIAVLGGVLHILFDYCNNYGVHPFWPLDNGWHYGDAVFIVEPWLLIAFAGVALGASRSWVSKTILGLVVLGLLVLAWSTRWVGVTLASLLTAGAGLWLFWMQRASARQRLLSIGIALGCFGALWLGTRHQARSSVERAFRESAPLVTLVSTPAPGNPLCWSVLTIQREAGDYVVRQGVASGWPTLWSAELCESPETDSTAPLRRAAPPPYAQGEAATAWGHEFRAPLAELLALWHGDCVVNAFLRFARVPFWVREAGQTRVIGDLRFDRSEHVEFSEIRLAPERGCPRRVPPWEPPLPLLRGG